MNRIVIFLFMLALFFNACSQVKDKKVRAEAEDVLQIDMSDFYVYTTDTELKNSREFGRTCYTMDVLNEKLEQATDLEKNMYNIELQTRRTLISQLPDSLYDAEEIVSKEIAKPIYDSPITIPVVINILEKYQGQISQSQIQSQIDVLNQDYNNNNPNAKNIPPEFARLVANCNITFTLAKVNRKISSKSSWGINDAMKFAGQGGFDVTEPSKNLNIWVCNIGDGVSGYAQFPGGNPTTDGVVIGIDYFGVNLGAYGKGRTCTHEVGHWLNLRHIWGDGGCDQDDFVNDTPRSDKANYGNPDYPTIHCQSPDMTMNFMDYVNDDCMYMFTIGQNNRIRALFAPGGAREGFVKYAPKH